MPNFGSDETDFETLNLDEPEITGIDEVLKDWNIDQAAVGRIILTHKDGSGVVVFPHDDQSIAATLLFRLLTDIIEAK